MTNYDKRICLATLIIVSCFLYMYFTKDQSDFAKTVVLVVITFYFGSSDKKGKGDFDK